jgi:hypothetical protein
MGVRPVARPRRAALSFERKAARDLSGGRWLSGHRRPVHGGPLGVVDIVCAYNIGVPDLRNERLTTSAYPGKIKPGEAASCPVVAIQEA